MTTSRYDPRSPRRRITDELREKIRSGELPPGARLPGIKDLMQQFDVSYETARHAINELRAMGLVETRQGKGSYVREYEPYEWWPAVFEHRDHRADKPGPEHDAWKATVAAMGRSPRQTATPARVIPPPVVARHLGTPDGEEVIVRYRTRYVDDVPVQTADSYYPLWVAEGTLIELADGDINIPGGLMAHVGHQQVRFDDTLTIRMPTPEDQRRLDLAATGTPVAEHVRVGFNADNRPVRVIITVAPGDRNILRWQFEA